MPVKEAKNVKERGGQMYYTLFLKFFSRNLFLCLHFEIISKRLLSNDEGSALIISFFSARHKLHIKHITITLFLFESQIMNQDQNLSSTLRFGKRLFHIFL